SNAWNENRASTANPSDWGVGNKSEHHTVCPTSSPVRPGVNGQDVVALVSFAKIGASPWRLASVCLRRHLTFTLQRPRRIPGPRSGGEGKRGGGGGGGEDEGEKKVGRGVQ